MPFTSWDADEDAAIGYHIMPVVLKEGTDRLAVMEHLKTAGIQTSIHYPPAHRFTAALPEKHPALPITESIAARELTLPFYPKMTREDVRLVSSTLSKALA
ncbi:MAG: DegT/DnrJ/EryC1/StrS family aminotransferase [bacterium]|nr:DegT/DnrJ/EryC1/StrS family aminotransferase [bacterium]